MIRRVHIDRLDIDVRGIPVATAWSAMQLLGPALKQALESHAVVSQRGSSSDALEAGRVMSSATVQPQTLANQIAVQISSRTLGLKS